MSLKTSSEEGEFVEAGVWQVKHEFQGKINKVWFIEEEKAKNYAVRWHGTTKQLYERVDNKSLTESKNDGTSSIAAAAVPRSLSTEAIEDS
jgi:hypothetical protein